ncbi:flagellar hook-length control protein FliK [Brevundimonas sp.]|uniref:flagellar hook-length control protein FliK n=1 Tax=Brevundimonas sp. TaxID=1871086 RepID=UPI0025C04CD3|nr:flagellar hook-length control protein FliK [Brevundimonas sp.]
MSALDLFAMLNAPLPGSGTGASASGQADSQAGGAFAGLLAMMASKGEGKSETATASTTASAGMSLAPFRFNGSASPAASDGAPAEPPGAGDGEGVALDAEAAVQAGLIVPPPNPAPPPAVPTLLTGAPAGATEATPAPAAPEATPVAEAPSPPPPPPVQVSPDAGPARPAHAADGALPAAAGQLQAPTPGGVEPGVAPLIASPPRAQGAQTQQTTQTTQTVPSSTPGALAAPAEGDAPPDSTPEPIRTASVADARAATEAVRAAGQQTATTALAPEAGRLVQPRPDTVQSDRRGDRREGEGRTALFTTPESGEVPRSSVAAPTPTNPAVTVPPPPRPGTAPVEARAEATPIATAPTTPDGEAAPEPVRAVESQSAASVRDHLPSTLARAGVETAAMLSAQIVRRLEARSTRFDMVLTPAHLGRVDVRMEVDSDGQLTARLVFDNPAAAAELRGRADELRRQLEAAGFQISDSSLEFAERDGGRREHPFDRRDRAFSGAGRLADTADAVSAPPRWTTLSLAPEGVDMKV